MPPHESLFRTATRSFLRSFSLILGLAFAVFIVSVAISSLSSNERQPDHGDLVVCADAQGHRALLSPHAPIILRLDIEGIIGTEDLTAEKFQNLLYDTLDEPLKGRIKALFLYVNTPGGTAIDAASIYHALALYKQTHQIPIYAFVEGLCASGGMYICAAADQIHATDASVIGSVGVLLGPSFNFSGLMEKIGVEALTITQGKDKDALNPFRPWKAGEDASIPMITKELYDEFVSVVTTGRPQLSRDRLINDYGAHVFLAKTAASYGYIDASNATYATTMKALADKVGLQDGTYQVFALRPTENFFAQLAQSSTKLLQGKIEHTLRTNALPKELEGQFLYLYQP